MTETANSDGGEIAVPGLHRHPRRKGKPLSAERRAKISAALKGKQCAPETRAKISAALKGKPLSVEHRAKLSAAKKGKNHQFFGKHLTPEHRAKLSAAARQREARKRVQLSTTIISSSR
jgi:hypothetical protein